MSFWDTAISDLVSVGNAAMQYRSQQVQDQIAKSQAQATLIQAQTSAAAQAASASLNTKLARIAMAVGGGLALVAIVSESRRVWKGK